MRERPAFDLFLVSWLVLFLELACIRWFPSHVLFLTFFVNLVLLACFVGMSVGCLVARRPTNFIRHTPYWLLAGVLIGLITDANSGFLQAVIAVGDQEQPDVVYFGTETSVTKKNPLPFRLPIELVGGLYFVLIAGIMVGPGQEMGRAFNRVTNRTTAYSANLFGSLVGIGALAACSLLRLPPLVWFGLAGGVLAYWVVRSAPNPSPTSPLKREGLQTPAPPLLGEGVGGRGSSTLPLACLLTAVILTAVTSGFVPYRGLQTTWSEYYRVDYEPKSKFILTNLISQQLMEPQQNPPAAGVAYALPYLFQRDLVERDANGNPVLGPNGKPHHLWKPFKRVLIIGAGNGNDVARALLWADPDTRIDAVEIDPVIQKLGAKPQPDGHPDQPFADPRVTVHINDGRNFLRKVEAGTYDLVVFALIDSLVLQSGYSNLRLESYLFTIESFKDVRRVLKPTGVYAVYNFFRQPWIAARIRDQLRTAFGEDPVVVTTPPRTAIRFDDRFDSGVCTGFFAGGPNLLDPLRKAFEPRNGRPVKYWYPWSTGVPKDTEAQFHTDQPVNLPPQTRRAADVKPTDPAPEWLGLVTAEIEQSGPTLRPADDNWPFLYTREARVPKQTWVSVVLTLVLSVGLWWAFGGKRALVAEGTVRPDYQAMLRAFFLGAGFMLVETKAVVEMALLFGGTWMVNTAVFAAILVMSLVGNLFAGKVNPKRLEPYYIGLIAALAVGLVVSPNVFLGAHPVVQVLGACALVFTPIAFAGVIFATSFKRTTQPDRVFGANVAGALVGGLAENSSVVLGFQLLLCVAVGFYLLSAAFGNRNLPDRLANTEV